MLSYFSQSLRSSVALILHVLHLGICVWIVGGWLIPYPAANLSHILLCLGAPLHWHFNKGRCFLTGWVLSLRTPISAPPPQHTPLTKQLLLACHQKTGWPLPRDPSIKRLVFAIPLISAALSALHLYLTLS